MVEISVFLKEGLIPNFPTVIIGMPVGSFIDEFGSISSIGFRNELSRSYYLGSFELIFYQDKLSSVSIPKLTLNECAVKVDKEVVQLNSLMGFDIFLNLLDQIDIVWEFNFEYSNSKSIGVYTQGNVNVMFDFSDGIEIDKMIKHK